MFNQIRHSTHRLRLWLLAATAILLVTSILEAGHVHGVFAEADDHCALCQHSVALDKVLTSSVCIIAPLLFTLVIFALLTHPAPKRTYHFALIRAPPVTPQRR